MAKLVVLYKNPTDKAAFDAYYESTHVPIAKKVPGLKKYEISTGPVKLLGGESPYHLVALLEFASTDALMQGLGSPEGKAAAGDLANFAQAGAELLVIDTKEV
ncbi:EthD family reductase [Paraburkholderia sp. GAS42]|jgi:uncharacterized protein (TIGR02118 family)|uniref:EthD family reductase n=1 Tax=Paraburkholderia sp. GAS42 TaxID=3035135 RepID=UPI003D2236B5